MLKVNFVIYYDIDGMEAKQVLRLDEYNGDEPRRRGLMRDA